MWAVIIYLLNTGNMSIKQLLANSACYARGIPQGDMPAVIAYLLASGTGGTGGGTSNLFANYGGAAPVAAGSSAGQIAVDSSTGKGWMWSGTAWINLF
jgi:hypothetical protein